MRKTKSRNRRKCSSVGVGRRLAEIRSAFNLSQRALATELGIKKSRLGSYEEERAPIPFDIAMRICRRFLISAKWLATGRGDKQQYIDVHLHQPGYGETPFQEVYSAKLADVYDSETKRLQPGEISFVPLQSDSVETLKNAVARVIDLWISRLDQESVPDFMFWIIRNVSGYGMHFQRSRSQRTTRVEVAQPVVVRHDGSREPFDYKRYHFDLLSICLDRPVDWVDLCRLCDKFIIHNYRSLKGIFPTEMIVRETLVALESLDSVAADRYAMKFGKGVAENPLSNGSNL